MSVLESFLVADLQNAINKRYTKSHIADAARMLWRQTLKKLNGAKAGTSEALAVKNKCVGNIKDNDFEKESHLDEFILNNVVPALYESIVAKKDKLENSVQWQAVLMAQDRDDQIDAMERFMFFCVDEFKKDCIETWRNKDGTFANVYRKTQRSLREHARDKGWNLYDPKSRFFGPAGIVEPFLRIDELDAQKLKEISLPSDPPVMKRIFFGNSIHVLSKWFYIELNLRSPQENNNYSQRTSVAIRNLARWLCYSYPLLASEENLPDDSVLEEGLSICDFTLEKEVKELARKTVGALTPEQRRVIMMKVEGLEDDEIAYELGFSSTADVSSCMAQIQMLTRRAKMEMPEMNSYPYTDSANAVPDGRSMEKLFSDYFFKYCAEGLQND